MAIVHSIGTRFGSEYLPSSFVLRIGRRELFVGRDFRRRFGVLNPILDCRTGVDAGHLELVLFSRWLIVLSRAW